MSACLLGITVDSSHEMSRVNWDTSVAHTLSKTSLFIQVPLNCERKNPNHTSLNENYVVPCICLRAIWHMHGSMWRATRMTRDRKRIIVAHCVIVLWRHYYYALAKFYCRGRVEGHFSGYPSHKTYTCQYTSEITACHQKWRRKMGCEGCTVRH